MTERQASQNQEPPAAASIWSAAMDRDSAFVLCHLGMRAKRLFSRALEPLDLRPNQVLVLNHLAAVEGVSQRALVEGLAIDPSSMVALLDAFEARGLAQRRPNPRDRRAYAIYLTDEGRAALQRALELSLEVEARLLAPLDEEERAQLRGLLMRVSGGSEEDGVDTGPIADATAGRA
jgi:DNA-binding MarR family transcriptional regulator